MNSSHLLTGSISRCAKLYALYGFAIYERPILRPAECERIVNEFKDAVRGQEQDFVVHRNTVGSRGERADFHLVDADSTLTLAPELFDNYDYMVNVATGIVGRAVVKSPHWRSSINLRAYDGGAATEGLHTDTNPLSVLVFLSKGAPLQIEINGKLTDIDPVPGLMAVFNGSEMPHRVPAQSWRTDQFRVTAPVNVYYPGQTDRPEWIDKLCYENMSYEDATR